MAYSTIDLQLLNHVYMVNCVCGVENLYSINSIGVTKDVFNHQKWSNINTRKTIENYCIKYKDNVQAISLALIEYTHNRSD